MVYIRFHEFTNIHLSFSITGIFIADKAYSIFDEDAFNFVHSSSYSTCFMTQQAQNSSMYAIGGAYGFN
jgi:hypothetical protein